VDGAGQLSVNPQCLKFFSDARKSPAECVIFSYPVVTRFCSEALGKSKTCSKMAGAGQLSVNRKFANLDAMVGNHLRSVSFCISEL
jgi:hypothetical protein